MQDEPLGPHWWLGTDGRWHAPEMHPRFPMRGGWREPPPPRSAGDRPRPATRDRGANLLFTEADQAYLAALSEAFDRWLDERQRQQDRDAGTGEEGGEDDT